PPSSTRSKTSGSSCATTGSPTASSNPTTISSITAARLGTSSSINPGASCPSDCANGNTGSNQWDLVLDLFHHLRVGDQREQCGAADDVAEQHGHHELPDHPPPFPVASEHQHVGFHAAGDDMGEAADRDQVGHQRDHGEL